MDKLQYRPAKHVTQPVKCRLCNNSLMLSRCISLNKLIRPCKCRPICELCYVHEIKEAQVNSQKKEEDTYVCYSCPRCSSNIYHRQDFRLQYFSPRQLVPSEKCTFYILLLQCLLILGFGITTLTLSLTMNKQGQIWIGICILVLSLLLQIMLIPNIITRFTFRFCTKRRNEKRPSAINRYLMSYGRYMKDIMEDDTSVDSIMATS